MNRVELVFNGISEIAGGSGLGVIILTDVERKRALNVVCDETMKNLISLRMSDVSLRYNHLPEVMFQMFSANVDMSRYEIMICDIVGGEYKTMIMNIDTLDSYIIRLSDAVLLSCVSGIPIYIEERLMQRQCSLYSANSNRMAIPINTISTEKLEEELNKAVTDEDYRLASLIKSELNKRKAGQQ